MRSRATLLLFFATILVGTAYGATETVEATITSCQLTFRREGSPVAPLQFRPEHVEVGFSLRATVGGAGEPFVFENLVNGTGHPFEPGLSLYQDGSSVLAQWWTGLPNEYVQFPMQFVQGDWQVLVEGGDVELLAPQDVVRHVQAQVSEGAPTGISPVSYFNFDGGERVEDGTSFRIVRESPFRPHFYVSDGLLHVEGMLSNFVITLETP
ncbi:MAG: hypothetical protein KDD51_05765 [Bdellovibrionales bacterium]|nr:hypothetical protein [Bdellovibrionales bacterium]